MKMTNGAGGPVTLDAILKQVGEFGRYQKTTLLLISLPIIFTAFLNTEFVFTADTSAYRCRVSECEESNSTTYKAAWLQHALPPAEARGRGEHKCRRFPRVDNATDSWSCSEGGFDRTRTLPCDDYVHESPHTINYEFKLECQEWKRRLIGTIKMLGLMLGLPISGYISDKYGRRSVLIFNSLSMAIAGIIRTFSVNYEMFVTLEFVESFLGGGLFPTCYIFATEMMGSKRLAASNVITSYYAIGEIILGLAAWFLPNWRTFIMVLYIPQMVMICYFWLFYESIRWLICKGKITAAQDIIQRAAKINKREISTEYLQSLQHISVATQKASDNKPKNIFSVMANSPIMLKRVIVLSYCWIAFMLAFYGLSFATTTISGNRYINFILVSAMEIPGYWIAYYTLGTYGRIGTLFGGFTIAGFCCVAFPFIPSELWWLSLILYLIGKGAMSAVRSSLYVYTSESSPTEYRNSILSFCSGMGRIGTMVAPLVPILRHYWHALPMMVFGIATLLASLLIFTQPETLGCQLPDSVEQAEQICTKIPKDKIVDSGSAM